MEKQPLESQWLTPLEVRQLLGMERSTFRDFLKANPLFPRLRVVGKTSKGKDILRFIRRQVQAYLDLHGS